MVLSSGGRRGLRVSYPLDDMTNIGAVQTMVALYQSIGYAFLINNVFQRSITWTFDYVMKRN